MPALEPGLVPNSTSGDSGLFLLDTNILVCAWDASDRDKSGIARDLIRRAVDGEGVVAASIPGEFAAVLLHKVRPRGSAPDVLAALDSLSAIRVVESGAGLVRRAVEAHQTYGIHFYDGMIVASAERAGCARIYTEDLNHGQRYFGVEATDPFR